MKQKVVIPLLFTFLFVIISPKILNAAVYADDCGGPTPSVPANIRVLSGPGVGQITLHWNEASFANRYAVVYGTSSNNYIYGSTNIGNETSRSYTVKHLVPGTRYYFRMAAAHDCNSSGFTQQVWGTAKGSKPTKSNDSTISDNSKQMSQTPVVARTGSVPESMPVSGPVGKQDLWGKGGPAEGQVTLYWQNVDSAEDYHLVYGTKPGVYQYGALNIGKAGWFKVGHLIPGVKYYFALIPLVANVPLYTSPSVGITAKINVQTVNMETPSVKSPATSFETKAAVKTDSTAPKTSPTEAPKPTLSQTDLNDQ